MLLVLIMLIGSLAFGIFFRDLNLKAFLALALLVFVAAIGYLYFKRFL